MARRVPALAPPYFRLRVYPSCLATGRRTSGQELRSPAPDKPLEFIKDLRIPPAMGYFLFHGLKRLGDGKRVLIWPDRSQRVINVNYLQHPGGNGDCLSSETIWIPRAIEPLMMVAEDG